MTNDSELTVDRLEHWTCDQQVAGSYPGRVVHRHVTL